MAHIVVIGAGPAGCAAAVELCELGHSVTLCDGGPSDGGSVAWPLVGDATRSAYIGGVGIGGSSSINGAVLGTETDPTPDRLSSFVAAPEAIGSALLAAGNGERLRILGDAGRPGSVADALDIEGRAAPRSTLAVKANCAVMAIEIDDGAAVGVRTAAGDITADAVIVAAGPVGSPAILSGLGVEVGSGLSDHRCLTVVLDVASTHPDGNGGDAAIRARASVAAEVDGGVLIGIDRFGAGSDLGGVLVASDTPSRGGRVTRSSVTGAITVDLGPLDPAPLATVWTFARPVVERVAATWGGQALIDEWGTPLGRLGTDSDSVNAWIRRSIGGLYHAAGTCRSAVDEQGRVLGLSGVFVAGAAVIAGPPRWPMAACVGSGRAVASAVQSDYAR